MPCIESQSIADNDVIVDAHAPIAHLPAPLNLTTEQVRFQEITRAEPVA